MVVGDIDEDVIREHKGVVDVRKVNNEWVISIDEESVVKSLFKCISKFDNITKFSVEDPSLNEIFISIVGDSYD